MKERSVSPKSPFIKISRIYIISVNPNHRNLTSLPMVQWLSAKCSSKPDRARWTVLRDAPASSGQISIPIPFFLFFFLWEGIKAKALYHECTFLQLSWGVVDSSPWYEVHNASKSQSLKWCCSKQGSSVIMWSIFHAHLTNPSPIHGIPSTRYIGRSLERGRNRGCLICSKRGYTYEQPWLGET